MCFHSLSDGGKVPFTVGLYPLGDSGTTILFKVLIKNWYYYTTFGLFCKEAYDIFYRKNPPRQRAEGSAWNYCGVFSFVSGSEGVSCAVLSDTASRISVCFFLPAALSNSLLITNVMETQRAK